MMTAFVLGGGGNLGAIQAGQARAILESGVKPDLIIGTSVGAINGAFIAARCDETSGAQLCDIWSAIRRSDVFPSRPTIGLSGLLGRGSHLVPNSGLRRLLRRHVPFDRLEDAPTPLQVVACELRTGQEVVLSSGPTDDAVCASAAIPGVLPPVTIDGRVLVDGGIANNTPISQAIAAGATTIWVLACGYACALPEAPRRAISIAMQSIQVLVQGRLCVDIERYRHSADLRIAPTLCPVTVGPADFSRSAQLAGDAYHATRTWIDEGTPDLAATIGVHQHD
jgi:NTE family protein